MIFDDHETLLNSNDVELYNDLCNEFDLYCFIATMLKSRQLYVKFRYAFFKVFALVEHIFWVEHSRTLICFLEVFIHFIQIEISKIAFILRDFIKKLFKKVTRREHSWDQICRLLKKLDSRSLDLTMTQIWKCTIDTFENELETFNRLAMFVRLDCIKRMYKFKENLEKERLLRNLLAQFDDISRVSISRVMLNLAHNLNR